MRSFRFAVVLLLLAGAVVTAGAQGSKRPNILFIMVDDLGSGDLASYGGRDLRTPHLDGLARIMRAYHAASRRASTTQGMIMWFSHVNSPNLVGP